MAELGWTVLEKGFFDIPPWPDIAMKKEDMLRRVGLNIMAKRPGNETQGRMCILDYYNGNNREMKEQVLKYDFLENMPLLFKKFWAHHRYFIFVPE